MSISEVCFFASSTWKAAPLVQREVTTTITSGRSASRLVATSIRAVSIAVEFPRRSSISSVGELGTSRARGMSMGDRT